MKVPNTIIVNGKRLVCRIFDTGPDGPVDRYTIAFKAQRLEGRCLVYPYLSADDNPFHPQGFGQHGESWEFMTGKHLGKRVTFCSLPGPVQRFVLNKI
jgi:hypothetical protein